MGNMPPMMKPGAKGAPPRGKGKKVNTAKMAAALRKPRMPTPGADAEEDAMQKGGYARGNGGVGSG